MTAAAIARGPRAATEPDTIYLDVDDTVVDLHAVWVPRVAERTGWPITVADHVYDWQWPHRIPAAFHDTVMAVLRDPDLYDAAPEMPGAVAGVAALRAQGHRLVLLTATESASKLQWLFSRGVLTPAHVAAGEYQVTHKKGPFARPNALLIDDGAHNLADFVAHGGEVLLMPACTNRALRTGGTSPYPVLPEGWADVPQAVAQWTRRQGRASEVPHARPGGR